MPLQVKGKLLRLLDGFQRHGDGWAVDAVIAYFEVTVSESYLFLFNANLKCHTETAHQSSLLPCMITRFLRHHRFAASKLEFRRLFLKQTFGRRI